jgi:ABC-type multidrug transport system ATPase subunit
MIARKAQVRNQITRRTHPTNHSLVAICKETSLFQILAGRLPSQGSLKHEGDIYFGGVKVDPRDREQRKLFAYVAQEDALHESSTPREALTFSAKLRLPRTTTDEEIDMLVEKKLTALGMESAADTVIGGSFKKGISGGERRRVSIGLELVASPSVILLDEPTSGLDSYAASQVMKLLGDVAKAGNTVLFTIHQPSSKIFSSFDRLIILKTGRVMHQGAVLDIQEAFNDAGYPCPSNYNPADWVIDVAESNDIATLQKSFLQEEPEDNKVIARDGVELVIPDRNHVSIWREFVLLEEREFREIKRNPGLAIINVSITTVLAFIFGVMFWDIGKMDRSALIVRLLVLLCIV